MIYIYKHPSVGLYATDEEEQDDGDIYDPADYLVRQIAETGNPQYDLLLIRKVLDSLRDFYDAKILDKVYAECRQIIEEHSGTIPSGKCFIYSQPAGGGLLVSTHELPDDEYRGLLFKCDNIGACWEWLRSQLAVFGLSGYTLEYLTTIAQQCEKILG